MLALAPAAKKKSEMMANIPAFDKTCSFLGLFSASEAKLRIAERKQRSWDKLDLRRIGGLLLYFSNCIYFFACMASQPAGLQPVPCACASPHASRLWQMDLGNCIWLQSVRARSIGKCITPKHSTFRQGKTSSKPPLTLK